MQRNVSNMKGREDEGGRESQGVHLTTQPTSLRLAQEVLQVHQTEEQNLHL